MLLQWTHTFRTSNHLDVIPNVQSIPTAVPTYAAPPQHHGPLPSAVPTTTFWDAQDTFAENISTVPTTLSWDGQQGVFVRNPVQTQIVVQPKDVGLPANFPAEFMPYFCKKPRNFRVN